MQAQISSFPAHQPWVYRNYIYTGFRKLKHGLGEMFIWCSFPLNYWQSYCQLTVDVFWTFVKTSFIFYFIKYRRLSLRYFYPSLILVLHIGAFFSIKNFLYVFRVRRGKHILYAACYCCVTVGGIMSLFSSSSSNLWTRCCNVSCSEGGLTFSVEDCFAYLHCERTLSSTLLGSSSLSSAWLDIFDLTVLLAFVVVTQLKLNNDTAMKSNLSFCPFLVSAAVTNVERRK